MPPLHHKGLRVKLGFCPGRKDLIKLGNQKMGLELFADVCDKIGFHQVRGCAAARALLVLPGWSLAS